MSMFTSLKLALMKLSVEESVMNITIKGFRTEALQRDIKMIWNTSKIGNNIFKQATGTTVVIDKFYALELMYILSRVHTEARFSMLGQMALRIQELLLENTWIGKTVKPFIPTLQSKHLSRFKKTPLPSQSEFFHTYDRCTQQYDLKGYLLAAPPGSGKTLSGLMLAAQLEAETVIIVSPKNAIDRVWAATLQNEYVAGPQPFWISNSKEEITGKEPFIICHYESLDRVVEKAKSFRGRKVFIILDECHNFNDIKSNRTNAFIELCNTINPIGVLWASGTPLKAMGAEMIPFLKTVDRHFNDRVQESFKKVFGMGQSHALDILSHRLGVSSYRVDKATVVSGEPIETTINVAFDGSEQYTLDAISVEMRVFIEERVKYYKQREAEDKAFFNLCIEMFKKTLRNAHEQQGLERYLKGVKTISATRDLYPYAELLIELNIYEKNNIVPNLPIDYRNRFKDVKSVIKYVHLKIRGEALGRILSKRRIDCNVDMVKHIDFPEIIDRSEKKTLIFTSFVEVVKEVERHLSHHDYKPLVVYGDTNKNLSSIINAFEKDSDLNPLIATYQSLSTAVPLIMANSVVLLNQPFRSIEREQSISRVHRLGQDSQVRIFNVLLDTDGRTNISTRSMDIMKWSQDQIDLMMGVKTMGDIAMESLLSNVFSLEMLDDIETGYVEHSLYDEVISSISW